MTKAEVSYPSPFVDAETVEAGYIAARPGIHGAIEFSFRPMTYADRQRYFDAASSGTDTPAAAMAKAVAKQLLGWSLDRDATPAMLEKLRAPLLESLLAIISGEAPSDPRDAEPETTEDAAA